MFLKSLALLSALWSAVLAIAKQSGACVVDLLRAGQWGGDAEPTDVTEAKLTEGQFTS